MSDMNWKSINDTVLIQHREHVLMHKSVIIWDFQVSHCACTQAQWHLLKTTMNTNTHRNSKQNRFLFLGVSAHCNILFNSTDSTKHICTNLGHTGLHYSVNEIKVVIIMEAKVGKVMVAKMPSMKRECLLGNYAIITKCNKECFWVFSPFFFILHDYICTQFLFLQLKYTYFLKGQGWDVAHNILFLSQSCSCWNSTYKDYFRLLWINCLIFQFRYLHLEI